ncbi:glucan 1 4-alpha-glucosidase [Apiospora phragmitis]|uniref:Glucan 1 4-alpha-glucosidase n=1 Tax=Apiospora phragmitis TaxID=2905665 RepID=A0ABR1WUR8_9PEZI
MEDKPLARLRKCEGAWPDSGQGPPISSPGPSGIKKRKRKEKKRRWVWTIGQEEEGGEEGEAMAAVRAAGATTPKIALPVKRHRLFEPLTAVKVSVKASESENDAARPDVEMSDVSSISSVSRATTPHSIDLDLKTPTVPAAASSNVTKDNRLGPMDLINPETGSRRDTPIPPDLVTN